MTTTTRILVLGATALTISAITVTGAGLHLSRSLAFFRDSPKEIVDEVWQVIDRTYVDGTFNQTDWKAIRRTYLNRSYKTKEEAYTAIREMLKKLGDPYTRFMDPGEFRNMQVDTSGELTGVGIQITQDPKTKEIVVIAPIEGTPAAAAGILAKDIIINIDGKTTDGMNVNDAVNLIRGKTGTEVSLSVRRGQKTLKFALKREKIEIHPVRYSVHPEPLGKVGYIRLVQFSANAGSEMSNAIKDLEKQNIVGYVLDLRSNPGGLLFTSIEIARMWLKEGTIVSTVDRVGETDREQANNSQLTQKPLIVLVNKGSASASEILSGALQENQRALLVGETTFGKGLVQSVRGLGDGSGMAVTIAKYLTPKGRDINKEGIAPDIAVILTEKQLEALVRDRDKIGTPEDPQYAKGLDVLKQLIAKQTPVTEKQSAHKP